MTLETQTEQIAPQAPPPPPSLPSEEEYASFTPEQREALWKEPPKPAVETPKDTPKVSPPSVDQEREPGEINVGDDGRVRDAKGRFVPFEAYGKVKSRNKELEDSLAKERDARAKLEGRTEELNKILGLLPKVSNQPEQPKAAEPPKEIDPEEDVIGALKQLVGWRKEVVQRFDKTEAERAAGEAQRQMVNSYTEDVKATLAELPDLGDAYAHVKNTQAAILRAQGINDEGVIKQLLEKAELDFVQAAQTNKVSAAKGLYAIAKAQGYVPKTQAAAPAAAPAAPAKSEAEQRLEAVKEGMKAAGSLSGASGGAPPAQYNLANMSEEEFGDLKTKLSKAEWRKLMGG